MKKKYILLMLLFISITICVFNNQKKEITTNKSKFNIYKEVDGEYQKQDTNVFPTTGYYLNTEESSCVNGSEVSQNSDYSVNIAFNKSDKCNLYYDKLKLVTFDANGGSVNIPSKYVKPGDAYGDLPTPERSGYTFLGWNGKNMFDEESIFMAISGATYQNGYYNFTGYNARAIYGGDYGGITSLSFDSNKRYSISFTGYVDEGSLDIYFRYTDGTVGRVWLDSLTEENYSFTSGVNIRYFSISYGRTGLSHIKNFQMEEGDAVTEFEPYFVSSTTKVTQNKDHTLKAIWREN